MTLVISTGLTFCLIYDHMSHCAVASYFCQFLVPLSVSAPISLIIRTQDNRLNRHSCCSSNKFSWRDYLDFTLVTRMRWCSYVTHRPGFVLASPLKDGWENYNSVTDDTKQILRHFAFITHYSSSRPSWSFIPFESHFPSHKIVN